MVAAIHPCWKHRKESRVYIYCCSYTANARFHIYLCNTGMNFKIALVICGWMMFGAVVTPIGNSRVPIVVELTLCFTAANPMKS